MYLKSVNLRWLISLIFLQGISFKFAVENCQIDLNSIFIEILDVTNTGVVKI